MKSTEEWNRLTFSYTRTPLRFVAHYANGHWDEGGLTKKSEVVINESAGVLQYAQTCFEGLKAYTAKDGRIVCFRPDLNAKRLADSARALEIPVFPEDKFLEAVKKWSPPTGNSSPLTAAKPLCICVRLCSPPVRCSGSNPPPNMNSVFSARPSELIFRTEFIRSPSELRIPTARRPMAPVMSKPGSIMP